MGLPEPLFTDLIDTFKVTFLRTDIMPDTANLTAGQFLQKGRKFCRNDVMEELGYTEGEAKYFIKKNLAQGKIKKTGRGKGTRYLVKH